MRRVVHAQDALPSNDSKELKAFAPLGVQRYRLALSSSGTLRLADDALIDEPGPRHRERTFGVVSSLDDADVASGVRVGAIYAFGSELAVATGATVRNYARAFGKVPEGAHQTKPQQLLALDRDLVEEYTWHVDFTASTSELVTEPGATLRPEPGHYASLRVRPGESASLAAGDYYFDTLKVERDGELRLENRSGPLRIWVKERLSLRGSLRELTVRGDLLWGYAGTSSPEIDCDFHGTLVASRSSLVLPKTKLPHVGAFFAHGILVEAGASIEQRSYILNEPPPRELHRLCQDCKVLAEQVASSCCDLMSDEVLIGHYVAAEAKRAMGRDCQRELTERYSGCLLQESYRAVSCASIAEAGPESATCAFQH